MTTQREINAAATRTRKAVKALIDGADGDVQLLSAIAEQLDDGYKRCEELMAEPETDQWDN